MNVLVVHKVSLLRRLGRAARGAPAGQRARWMRSDVENRAALTRVVQILARTGWKVDVRPRGERLPPGDRDLLIVVGGDGTFFDVARHVSDTPILLVNSDPPHSLALFSCGDAQVFAWSLPRLKAGRMHATRLHRLAVRVGARTFPPVLNDILFAHRDPAAMSRYEIAIDGRHETQRSSGVWISTAAGSTAAILSAGGRMMPIASREIQVRVREPYRWDGAPYRLTEGFARRRVLLRPHDPCMDLWLDGNRHRVSLAAGDEVEISTDAPPLTLLGYDDRRRRRLFAQR